MNRQNSLRTITLACTIAGIAGCNPTWTTEGNPNGNTMPMPPGARQAPAPAQSQPAPQPPESADSPAK